MTYEHLADDPNNGSAWNDIKIPGPPMCTLLHCCHGTKPEGHNQKQPRRTVSEPHKGSTAVDARSIADGEIDKILVKLIRFVEVYAEDEDISEPDREAIDVAKQAIEQYCQQREVKVEKAYGGCNNCYGKGYATVRARWVGSDTDTDIGSPGGVVTGGQDFVMKFCTCDRGKQLSTLLANQNKLTRDGGEL